MSAIVKVTAPVQGPGEACWHQLTVRLSALLEERGVHPARAVVLLPYAQLMKEAKSAWAATAGSAHFVPRFETTMNWATSLGGWEPSPGDLAQDAARDVLTAAALLTQAGLGAQKEALAGRLVEAAWSLARVAAAVTPAERPSWGAQTGALLGAGLDAGPLQLEAALGRIALAWAASSGYPTDGLFSTAAPKLLVVLEGFQAEPLTEALKKHFGRHAVSLALDAPGAAHTPALHPARDADDEAQLAAACVLAHLAQGRSPVGLVAQDRELTRRVRAMLGERGVALRDETGWKLSTTRAAAAFMSLLRALSWNASTDEVLDWLKNAPAFDAAQVLAAEKELRRLGVRQWRAIGSSLAASSALAEHVRVVQESLQRPRQLAAWLRDLRTALQASGQWDGLAADVAGQAVLDTLRLHEGAEAEFSGEAGRMGLADFSNWASQALEAANFAPAHPPREQVVVLPLSQLLGRTLQAVVLPGCDEVHLPVSPEPAGPWTPAQRELLGLPLREAGAAAQRSAWDHALRFPWLDILWRQSEGGEQTMPSGFVQELLLQGAQVPAPDPRELRQVTLNPTLPPMPTGEALPVQRLSASAYEDLRRCPYRFFALRQLRLQEADELDSELGKREFGNWLHTLLKVFHEALQATPAINRATRVTMIDAAATQAATELGLSDSEFLPFEASWPRVREGYLDWLEAHEAQGAGFDTAEVSKEVALGPLTLIGKIDRIDRLADGSTLVIDYKTENRTTTLARLKEPQEDTQLAFYAGLLDDDTLAAAYVNIGEKDPTKTYEQADIVELRDELLDSILTDMARITRGMALPALGEGKACDYCSARGLCRKDFWS